jgi:predicted AlkP superfamily pyrophosphatase or phosphodiesterase
MKKALLLLLLLGNVRPASPAAPKKPKLVLAIVVDQFRYDYLTRFRGEYHSGLARLLEKGAVFTNAHHVSFPTVTAIGHATFLTGATPSVSGIAGNEWYDRDTKRSVTSVQDDGTDLLGAAYGAKGSSPKNLLVSTLGDEIKMQGIESKVIGVSIKDRSAILPVGHMADGAYWIDADSNRWVSSSYYMKKLPAWVKDVNDTRPIQKYLGQTWNAVDAQAGAKPFCSMAAGTEVEFCGPIETTPWGNEMIEEFAEQALVKEQMGKHPGTDILAVSFSSNDYVGHKLGPDAPEVRDMSIRTDRLLGKFFDFVDAQVGAENVLVVLTADHGVGPVPEVNAARHMPGGRLNNAAVVKAAQEALAAKYGEGKWVESSATSATGSIYLNRGLIESKKLSLAEVEETAAAAMLTTPHVYRVYTGEAISTGRVSDDYITTTIRNGYFPQRSADVLFVAEPFYLFGDGGTTHGTPYDYDTHVPIIFLGSGIKAGSYYTRVGVPDIAPTLAGILGVPNPTGAVGRVLSEIFE